MIRTGARALWVRIRGLPPPVVLAIGLVLPFLYAFPGMMSQDSFDLLIEARSGVFTDAHPPFNAALWRVMDSIIPGAFGMLLIQLVGFELGTYLVLRRTFAATRAAWLAVAVFWWPPILAPMGMIWKDCTMAAMLVLGTGLLLSDRRLSRAGGLVALLCAIACRYNAFPGVMAIVILLFQWRPGVRRLHRYALATLTALAISLAAFGLNAALTDRKMYFWHSTLAIYDIAGTLVNVDGTLSDPEMETLLAGTEPQIHQNMHAALRELYSPREYIYLISPERRPMWNLPLYGNAAPAPVRGAIAALWWKLLREHPGAYLEHRFDVMREILCLGTERAPIGAIPRRIPYFPNIARDLGINTGWSTAQKKISRGLLAIWRTFPIFAPWIYLVVALSVLWIARKHRDVLALLFSGLLVEATLLVLAMSPDYRYSHWMIIATTLAVIILVGRRYREVRSGRAAAAAP